MLFLDARRLGFWSRIRDPLFFSRCRYDVWMPRKNNAKNQNVNKKIKLVKQSQKSIQNDMVNQRNREDADSKETKILKKVKLS